MPSDHGRAEPVTPVTRASVRTSIARLGRDRAAQHPLEGRAAHDERSEVGVAGLGVAEIGDRRQRGAPLCEERVEHVGEPVPQLDPDPGEEAVGLVHLRGAPPLGGERRFGVGLDRQRVGLEQEHRVPGAPERERRGQAADPAADHRHLCRSAADPAVCSHIAADLPERG